MMMGWDSGWGGTMMFGGVLVWGGFLVLLVLLVRGLLQPNSGSVGDSNYRLPSSNQESNQKTPMELLQARYAKGEITREEFQTMRQNIESPPDHSPPKQST